MTNKAFSTWFLSFSNLVGFTFGLLLAASPSISFSADLDLHTPQNLPSAASHLTHLTQGYLIKSEIKVGSAKHGLSKEASSLERPLTGQAIVKAKSSWISVQNSKEAGIQLFTRVTKATSELAHIEYLISQSESAPQTVLGTGRVILRWNEPVQISEGSPEQLKYSLTLTAQRANLSFGKANDHAFSTTAQSLNGTNASQVAKGPASTSPAGSETLRTTQSAAISGPGSLSTLSTGRALSCECK